ncbi:hypothetical protein HanIR_Chr11g0536161 [Helianthus annuus]|nr:hypothetical protein HanIR_Chr11g0536161 [Helianthus annuus]
MILYLDESRPQCTFETGSGQPKNLLKISFRNNLFRNCWKLFKHLKSYQN